MKNYTPVLLKNLSRGEGFLFPKKNNGKLHYWLFWFFFVIIILINTASSRAQSPICEPSVPYYTVDLRGNPAGFWQSPSFVRNGYCCGATGSDRCLNFEIYLDSQAVALKFEITSGALPIGALYYRVGCGPQIPITDTICLSGEGPHQLTFCKPGNNTNTYRVKSIPKPIFPLDDSTRAGCPDTLKVNGLDPATVTWTSVFPGAEGQYNSYLSCTSNCTTATFNPVPGSPPLVKYKICGSPYAADCGYASYMCDTVNLKVFPEFVTSIYPDTGTICETDSGVFLYAIADGGGGAVSYTWKNQAGEVISNDTFIFATSPGQYKVEIKDELSHCVIHKYAIPVVEDFVNAGITSTLTSCFGGSNGTATVSGSAGFPPYNFIWGTSPVQTSATASGLFAGSYNVTVTDDHGCSKIVTANVSQPPLLNAGIAAQTNVNCFGSSNGSASVSVTGGTTPYAYAWSTSPVKTSSAISGLTAGTYLVTVTDYKGCTDTSMVIIMQPDTLMATLFADTVNGGYNVSGCGSNDGSINLLVAGGTQPYIYQWSTGAITEDINGLNPGFYNVVVADANGCTANASEELSQPDTFQALSVITPVVNGGYNISCYGQSNGSINIVVSGGASPYSYLWSDGETNEVISGIGAGLYSVTVTDANGCTIVSSANVTQPDPLGSNAAGAEVFGGYNISCDGMTNGSIDLTVNGGTQPYNFQWSNGATSEDVSNLGAGTYSVTVTDDNGCTATTTATLTQPSPFVSGAASPAVNGGYNISCNGLANGSINLSVNGGTEPFAYQWNNGGTSASLNNLGAGTYSVTVTDANGCVTTSAATLTQPAPFSSGGAAAIVNGGYNISCNGMADGSIDLSVSGGTAPYNYQWSNGSTSLTVTGLSAGSYSVTVTDANNCVTGTSVTLTQPNPFSSLFAAMEVYGGYNISCNGLSDGAIDLTLNGGTGPYIFLWSNGETIEDISNLGAGNYSVTATDANGCLINAAISLYQPEPFASGAASPAVNGGYNISCDGLANGSINLTITGGTMPYAFQWNNGELTEDIGNLPAGDYSVTVTDMNGCTTGASATLTQPQPFNSGAAAPAVNGGYNISCDGMANGSVDLNVNGGTAPYTFMWSNGVTTEDIYNLSAGDYFVTVTDANGCTAYSSASLTQPPPFGSDTDAAIVNGGYNISCFGLSDGAIDITVNGGTTPYAYLWNNPNGTVGTTEDISNVPAGNYSVTVTDANGCTTNTAATLTEPPPFTSSLGVSTLNGGYNISCNGLADGSLILTVNGGTGPYEFLWSNSAISASLTGLTAGTYSVTATDANGCTVNEAATLLEPNSFASGAAAATVNGGYNISCVGLANGSIDLSVSGGTIPYYFNWSNGETSEDLSNLSAGNYSVTVTDDNGCVTETSATLTQPPPFNSGAAAAAVNGGYNISCDGMANGSIDLSITGGTMPYNFLWSNGASVEDINNLPAGVYNVTVTDDNGCTVNASATLTQPPPFGSDTDAAKVNGGYNISCFGFNDGSIDVIVSGGTQPYNYEWNNGAVTEDISNLTAGTYSVTITDANGCTTSTSSTLTQPALLESSYALSLVNGGYNISCNGLSDGAIDLTVSGGAMPYNFQWSNGSTSLTVTGLSAGTYSVTVIDANGCILEANAALTQPAPVTVALASPVFNGGYNIRCFGTANGFIDLMASGGTQPFIFTWSNGETTEDILNLEAGIYSVTITDANNCAETSALALTEPSVFSSTTAASLFNGGYNISCFGASDGAIDLTPSGGTLPYTFQWSNGSTSLTVTGLSAGSYSVTATDANGCITNASLVLSQPDSLSSLLVADTVNGGFNVSGCNSADGTIDLTVSGGTLPYTYQWSNGAATQDLNGIGSGTFSVLVTDDNNCLHTASVQLTEPSMFNATSASPEVNGGYNISCSGSANGSISVNISGGTAPYNFQWSNGSTSQNIANLGAGIYSVTVTDANGCATVTSEILTEPNPFSSSAASPMVNGGYNINCSGMTNGSIDLMVNGGTTPYTYLWSNGSTSLTVTGLSAGSYSVTVTDANGCIATASATLTQPDPFATNAASATVNGGYNISCDGFTNGSIDLTVSGGTMPYNYQWNNGALSEDLGNLTAGNYTVTVTDANGCAATASAVLTQPAPFASGAASPAVNGGYNISCNGQSNGSIDLTVIGGTTPYIFQWSNGSTSVSVTGLSAGSYSVTVTDANGCLAYASANLTQPDPFASGAASPTVNGGYNIGCNGMANGSIDLSVSGGTTPYFYQWSNGAATQDLNNLFAGTYTVTVTDANGCETSAAATLTQPALFSSGAVSPTVSGGYNIGCNGYATGSVDLTVDGGTPPYSYLWNNGSTSPDLVNLMAGSYSVTVTDANGCTTGSTAILTQPPPFLSGATAATVNGGYNIGCNGMANGSIDLAVNGGTGPFIIEWSNGSITEDISNLTAGVYYVTVTDANGCMATDSVSLTQPDPFQSGAAAASVNGGYNIGCNGQANGSIDLTISGGTLPYLIAWNNGASTEDIANLAAGIYSVTITDANGCVASDTANLTEPPPFESGAVSPTYNGGYHITCFGFTDGSIDVTISGGTSPYSFLWSNGATTEDLNEVGGGNYSLTVTDANGCVVNETMDLQEPLPFNSSTLPFTVSNVICYGASDGSIDVTPSGGTPPYSFQWENGDDTEDHNNLVAGVYSLIVYDMNKCTADITVIISQPTELMPALVQQADPKCFGSSDGLVAASASGGISPYTFQWSNGFTGQSNNNLSSGVYTVVVTDANGCTKQLSPVELTNPDSIAVSATVLDETCHLNPDGSIQLSTSGGTAPYTYQWSNGSSSEDQEKLSSGIYQVRILDANGCYSDLTASIKEQDNTLCALEMPTGYSPNQDGRNDYFVVKGIEYYRTNILVVYNRWGNEVFRKDNYKNEWDGKNSAGDDLPDGTYFCILSVEDKNVTLTGYCELRR